MRKLAFVAAAVAATTAFTPRPAVDPAMGRWEKEAANVTIIRDDWGIAHIHGKTDADAVFGMIYAQAEDDFNRVENNFMVNLGRVAESEGESKIWQDLRARLIINDDSLKAGYASSPQWLKSLMDAWADGLNFYLAKHPNVKPKAISHWEPWMALSFTEGSVGGDIEKVNVGRLQAFYGGSTPGATPAGAGQQEEVLNQQQAEDETNDLLKEPSGSNGIVISPNNTTVHHALLMINPHTSFFFRSELQMQSDEGLNAYGAVTWGQFFVYQGWNDHAGWMHTSSGVDATDEFLETVTRKGDGYTYRIGTEEKPVRSMATTIRYKDADGSMKSRKFTIYYTEHGPVVRQDGDKWVSFALMNSPVKALTQSYSRTKAHNYKEFRATMELHTNSSNNTLFADKDGDIAYFHGNYIPRRDTSFDWTRPVDGSNPATQYKGLLSVDETPHLLNPASGWIYNSNDSPWQSAGPSSPKKEDYPKYVENGGESARGHHAVRVLSNKKDFTLNGLRDADFDSYQTYFEKPIPALIKAWDDAPASDPNKAKTADQIALLRNWDLRWGAKSVETSLAIYWAQALRTVGGGGGRGARGAAAAPGDTTAAGRGGRGAGRGRGGPEDTPPDQMLAALVAASDKLTADFGSWKTPWGDINRFQRLNDDIVSTFSDAQPSVPVEFSSANYGSLASFGARAYPGTKKIYGTSGNSFVAAVEFGDSVRAIAVTAGGESGDPNSKHFNDQAVRYANGDLRPVYYYPSQLKGHTERTYHPGE